MAATETVSEYVISDAHASFAQFIVACKGGDAEKALEFLRAVGSTLDPDDLKPTLPRKKAKVTAPPAQSTADAAAGGGDGEAPLDCRSYHVGDEADEKLATMLLLIPNKSNMIAAVIGKSGASIAQIQKASGARVQVEKNDNKSVEHVEVTITGPVSANDIAQAMIMRKIASAGQGQDTAADAAPLSTMLIVPNQAVRFLIGKGGSVIKDLQSASGAHIQFQAEKDMSLGSAGRQVTVQATSEVNRNKCVYLLSRKMAEDTKVEANWVPKKEARVQQQAPAPEPFMGVQQGFDFSTLLGAAGNNFMAPQQNMYQNLLPQQQQQQQQQMPQMPSMPSNPLSTQPPSAQYSGGVVGGVGGGMSGLGALPFGAALAGEANTTVELLVPNMSVSRLIGKQGKNIQDLQTSTGARIQFQKESDMLPGATDRKVTLTGTSAQTTAAQQMITMNLLQIQAVVANGGNF